MENAPIRLLLVEDHLAIRDPMAELFDRQPDLQVVGLAATLAEARALLAGGTVVDVALVDLDLPDGRGSQLVRELRQGQASAVAIVLTGSVKPIEHARAIGAGAACILPKAAPIRDVLHAIRRLHAGETLLSVREMTEFMRLFREDQERQQRQAALVARLTARDRELLALLGQGLSDRQIAERLYLGERTVRNYMTLLFDKFEVDSRAHLVALAKDEGLV